MKKVQLIILLIFVITLKINAQKYKTSPHEIGFMLGVANYMGDLSKSGDVAFFGDIQGKAFRPAVGIFYRNNFYKFFNFRANLTIGQVYGNDKYSPSKYGLQERNLHFRSNIIDISLLIEWNILPFKIAHYKYRFTPYLAGGVGGFYINPKAKLNGNWVALQALGTEGQGLLEYPDRTKYSKMNFSIPFGAGFKLNLGRLWCISAEMMYHYTFIDYIDDVSTSYPDFSYYYNNNVEAVANEANALSYRGDEALRESKIDTKRGNSTVNDHYFFIMIGASVQISGGKTSCNTVRRGF